MKKIILLIGILAGLGAIGFSNGGNVNSNAPDFSAETPDKSKISLSDFKDKVVLLDFWASWCGPCRKEFPFLMELYKTYKEKGFEIIAVNLDSESKRMEAFLEKQGAPVQFKIALGNGTKIPDIYKLEGMPTTILIDKKGVIRFRHTGFSNSDKKKYEEQLNLLLNE
jgi:thiol-disulfide isomerase/thioredoxin